jgi:hypothetical protein
MLGEQVVFSCGEPVPHAGDVLRADAVPGEGRAGDLGERPWERRRARAGRSCRPLLLPVRAGVRGSTCRWRGSRRYRESPAPVPGRKSAVILLAAASSACRTGPATMGYAVSSPGMHGQSVSIIVNAGACRDQKVPRRWPAVSDTIAVPPQVASLQGMAIAGVFQIIISEARPAHPRGPEPAGDRRRAAPGLREHPRRTRPLAQRSGIASNAVSGNVFCWSL